MGTLLLTHKCIDAGLLEICDPGKATSIYKQTLSWLVRSLGSIGSSIANLEQLLTEALASRNRLTHAFHLQHNFCRNSNGAVT